MGGAQRSDSICSCVGQQICRRGQLHATHAKVRNCLLTFPDSHSIQLAHPLSALVLPAPRRAPAPWQQDVPH